MVDPCLVCVRSWVQFPGLWGEGGNGKETEDEGPRPHFFPSVSLLGPASSRLILGGGVWARWLAENRPLVLFRTTPRADGGLPSFVTFCHINTPNSTTSGEQSLVSLPLPWSRSSNISATTHHFASPTGLLQYHTLTHTAPEANDGCLLSLGAQFPALSP